MDITEVPRVRWITPDQRVQITEQHTGSIVYEGPGPIPDDLLQNGKSYYWIGSISYPVSVRCEWPTAELT